MPEVRPDPELYEALLLELPLRKRGREYVRSRGLPESVAARFGLAEFDPNARDTEKLREVATKARLQRAGLMIKNRLLWQEPALLIPFAEGKVINYIQARITEPHGQKYLNLRGLSQPVFNLNSLRELPSGSDVLICEGVFDVMRAFSLGFAAVAWLGHGEPPHSLCYLLRDQSPVVVPDRDSGGQVFAKRVTSKLVAMGFTPRVWKIPFGTDLDDWGKTVQETT